MHSRLCPGKKIWRWLFYDIYLTFCFSLSIASPYDME